jgi:hypothetical protein
MIPKNQRQPAPAAPADERPDDAPPVEHRAIDIDIALSNGANLALTIVDGNGHFSELPDRFVFEQDDTSMTILKTAVAYVRRSERVYTTEPEPFRPDNLS